MVAEDSLSLPPSGSTVFCRPSGRVAVSIGASSPYFLYSDDDFVNWNDGSISTGVPGALFGKMQEFQARMEEMQAKLAEETVTAESGGGMVRVVANGRREVVSVEIEREVVDPEDVGMLQDLIVAAVNAAVN